MYLSKINEQAGNIKDTVAVLKGVACLFIHLQGRRRPSLHNRADRTIHQVDGRSY